MNTVFTLKNIFSNVWIYAIGSIIPLMVLFLCFFIIPLFFPAHKHTLNIVALPLAVFIMLAQELIRNQLSVFDSALYGFISKYISHNMTDIMRIISFFGSAQFLISLALLILIFAYKYKLKNYRWFIAYNLAITWILNDLFKYIFHRQRPDILRLTEVSGYSFPSGHSMTSISFYGLIIYMVCINIKKGWIRYTAAVSLGTLIALIGISRVYLGVHYASDVLAGFCAGTAWLIFYTALFKRYFYVNDGKVK